MIVLLLVFNIDLDLLLSFLHVDPALLEALGRGKEVDELSRGLLCLEVAMAQTEQLKRVPAVRAIEGGHNLLGLLRSEEVAVSQPENLQSFLTCQSGHQSIDFDLASLFKESEAEADGLKI